MLLPFTFLLTLLGLGGLGDRLYEGDWFGTVISLLVTVACAGYYLGEVAKARALIATPNHRTPRMSDAEFKRHFYDLD